MKYYFIHKIYLDKIGAINKKKKLVFSKTGRRGETFFLYQKMSEIMYFSSQGTRNNGT